MLITALKVEKNNFDMIKKIVLIILICVLPFFPSSQELENIFENISNAYKQTTSYSLEIVYTLYSDTTKKTALDFIAAHYIKDQNSYYYITENECNILDETHFIAVDHSEKTITISEATEEITDMWNGMTQSGLESEIHSGFAGMRINKKDQRMHILSYIPNDERIDNIIIRFDPTNYFIREMQIYFNDIDSVSGINQPLYIVKHSAPDFDISRYNSLISNCKLFGKDGDTFYLKEAYKNIYRLREY